MQFRKFELAEARLSLDKRIQAVIHYLTKNAAETVRKLQFQCEAISKLQLYHSFDGIFNPIIRSD